MKFSTLLSPVAGAAGVFAALGLVYGLAGAANLKPFQKEASEAFDKDLAESLKAANEACGVKLTIKTNFEAFKAEEWSGQSIYSRCSAMLDAATALCGRKAYKDEFAKRIKEVHCLFGGKDGGDNEKTLANMSVSGKALVYKMHPNNSNLQENAQKTLEKALNQ